MCSILLLIVFFLLFIYDEEKNKLYLEQTSKTNENQFSNEIFISNKEIKEHLQEHLLKIKLFLSKRNKIKVYSLSKIFCIFLFQTIVFKKGVLVQAFSNGIEKNIHHYNLSLMMAYQLFFALKSKFYINKLKATFI